MTHHRANQQITSGNTSPFYLKLWALACGSPAAAGHTRNVVGEMGSGADGGVVEIRCGREEPGRIIRSAQVQAQSTPLERRGEREERGGERRAGRTREKKMKGLERERRDK